MTTITIRNGEKLSKTHFESWEEVQEELILMQENFELSEAHVKILKAREDEADKAQEDGISWQELKAGISRKNA